MIKLNTSQQNQLKKAEVVALILFGSKALGIDGPLSDTDIAVILEKSVPENQTLRKSAEYDLLISEIFPNTRNIEVTLFHNAPIGLKATILKEGKLIFCSDYRKFADIKEKVIIKAGDFLPFYRFFLRDRLNHFYAHTN